ncbi:MAG TPA: hypothetical protein VIA82_04305 [Candidatus Limnocylindria bacterium]|jgi:hypothetical protein
MEQHRQAGETFEQLWLLRACYALRSDYDSRSTLTVDEAVAYGQRLLRLVRLRERWSGYGTTNRTF